jgi:peptidoglycan-associated lipoprotein
MIPLRYLLMIPVLALGCVNCAGHRTDGGTEEEDLADTPESPRRANLPAYTSAEVQRGKLEGIVFPDGAWQVPVSEKGKIRIAATWLKVRAERVILAGGAGVSSPEYARQLGQQRAMAVRDALVDEGIPANRITTMSYGADLPGKGGDRVELGLVPTGEKPF